MPHGLERKEGGEGGRAWEGHGGALEDAPPGVGGSPGLADLLQQAEELDKGRFVQGTLARRRSSRPVAGASAAGGQRGRKGEEAGWGGELAGLCALEREEPRGGEEDADGGGVAQVAEGVEEREDGAWLVDDTVLAVVSSINLANQRYVFVTIVLYPWGLGSW